MRFHFQQALKAMILLAFFGLIFKLHITNEIGKYINVEYALLSKIAAVIFLSLFIIQLQRVWTVDKDPYHEHDDHCNHEHIGCNHDHDHGLSKGFSLKVFIAYTIIIIPILTGALLPAKTLDSAIAAKKGVLLAKASPNSVMGDIEQQDEGSTSSSTVQTPNPNKENQLVDGTQENATDQVQEDSSDQAITYFEDLYEETLNELKDQSTITMKEKNFVSYADTIGYFPSNFKDKEIEVMGFVYKEEGMDANQFVISRFIITHCVADAGVIGFLTETTDAPKLEVDSWVKLKGTLDVTNYNDYEMPIIKLTEWELVEAPADPYVYP